MISLGCLLPVSSFRRFFGVRTVKLRLHLRLRLLRSIGMDTPHTTNNGLSEYPEEIYEFQDYVEDLEYYSEGGFYPIEINDEIKNGQYRIIHKLGYGAYSTVWLAMDQLQSRLVSLKFTVACTFISSAEVQVLQKLGASSQNHPGRQFVLTLLDEFEVKSANGSHRCMVMDAVGPSLSGAKEELDGYRLPVNIARKVAMQCAKGLAYIHSCGIVHGDLHHGNILFKIPGLESWTVDQVYEHFGEPRKEPIRREDGQPLTCAAPQYTVRPPNPQKFIHMCITEQCSVQIADFGEAFFAVTGENVVKKLHTPPAFSAPEIMLSDESVGAPVDIWAFGCTLYSIFSSHMLIESFFSRRDELLYEMVRTLGKLPERWWHKWGKREIYFEEDGVLKPNFKAQGIRSLKQCVGEIVRRRHPSVEMQEFDLRELAALESVLEDMLRYEPAERIQAEEVVRKLSTTWEGLGLIKAADT